ncbi:hypothetical protein AUP07_0955 [methanogenic archaeon mixed culture ISO4-G1]|nr:hypothetical protein AUP07_0955 [methanogenic archaeon mixed culture ISO4-G1]
MRIRNGKSLLLVIAFVGPDDILGTSGAVVAGAGTSTSVLPLAPVPQKVEYCIGDQ